MLTAVLSTAFSQDYNMGSQNYVSTCSGNFYDNGGIAGNYTNDFNDTITFQSNSNSIISVLFTSVSLMAGDNLYVYFGNSATGTPDITNPAAGLIKSNCCCITFVFVSNSLVVSTGWAASINCAAPAVANDYPVTAYTALPDGSFLTGQSNVGAKDDLTSDCFDAGNTVWYSISLTGGMNTIDVTMQNATFPDVQYLLIYDYSCLDGSAEISGAQCMAPSEIANWTNLTHGNYWLGIATEATGTFDLSITESYLDYCGDFYCGSGESCLTCPFDCGICPETEGGPYFHTTKGMQSTNLGQCITTTNAGTYFDNSGPANAYSNDIQQVFRTFCPKSTNNIIQATINVLSVEYAAAICNDQLYVRDGPSEYSTVLWSGCGNLPTVRTLSGNYNSGVFQSSDESGCLTFTFNSNGSNSGYWEGWEIELLEIPSVAGPDLNYNNDCVRAIPLCNDYTVSSQMFGPGLISEACGSCALAESYSEWYKVKVSSGGTMEFEITPLGNSDMDFAIYQVEECGELSSPIRCSHAFYAPPGKTGLRKHSGDMSEDVYGDQWVSEIKVETGKMYYIMINEWNKNNPNSYTLDFKLSDGASFDCSIVLPVTFLDFSASVKKSGVELIWKTASETNNDFFTIERSTDGFSYVPLATMDGSGNSNEIVSYFFMDENPVQGLAYYRIKQTDFDGNFDYSQTLPVDFLDQKLPWLNVYPSPATEILHISTDESSIDATYSIYNALGAIVETGHWVKTEFDLQIADFDDGMYYLSINGSKQVSFMVSH